MKKRNPFRFWSELPDPCLRFALAAQRVAQVRPTRKTVAATQKRSLKFMRVTRERAQTPFRSVALGGDGKPAPVDPLFQSHP
jgi:hypothetical protein